MKDRRGGAVAAAFPSSIGCISHSAISVADALVDKKQPRPHAVLPSSTAAATPNGAAEEEEGGGGGGGDETSAAAPALGIVAAGVQRLIKGIKSLTTHMFAAAHDGGEEDEEEIVIGYPTDVVHVGHIGWDGAGGLSKVGGVASAFSQLPSSSLSLRQLEIAAMEAASSHA